MKGKWIEIWGKEPDEVAVYLLYKFPAKEWDPKTASEFIQSIKDRGVTEIEVREVDEGGFVIDVQVLLVSLGLVAFMLGVFLLAATLNLGAGR